MLPYGRQEISQQDIDAVVAALRAPLITQGPLVDEFEKHLADSVQARFAVAFNSGTAALHAAYHAAGLGPSGGLLTSPITFVATANAARYLGAPVYFADVMKEYPVINESGVILASGERISLLAVVHFGGHVAPMEELEDVARRAGWVLVEDAAHALGALYTTRDGAVHRVGSCRHSHMCCFSFHAVKHITTGEGGAVTTNHEQFARRLRRFRTHGITREPAEMHSNDGPWYYEQHELGFNYRITDFQCALGLSQLSRLEAWVRRRREIASLYDSMFSTVDDVKPLSLPPGSIGSYHLYVIRVPSDRRRKVFEELRAMGIGVQVHYIPVPRHPYYRGTAAAPPLPNADEYYSEAISLPMYPALTDSQVEEVASAVSNLVSRPS